MWASVDGAGLEFRHNRGRSTPVEKELQRPTGQGVSGLSTIP
jgi:hypothetical protein